MRRAALFQFAGAVQAAVLAAACSFDRSGPHPLTVRRTQIGHLLRRAGFAASRAELDEYEALGLARTIDRLLDPAGIDDDVESRLGAISLDLKKLADMQRWWFLRMLYSKRPLVEKMTLFWHGLLTSATSKVGLPNPTPQNPDPPHYMWAQHQFLRDHALGRFEDLVLGVGRDPAMMIWLDSQTNVKGKPNENFARELMELFTLGEGNYTEQDVREAARAFTGWGLDKGAFVFRATNHDNDSKIVLGKRGNLDGKDVVAHLVRQPAAARYLSRRLWEFFAYPNPADQDLEPLVAAYTRSDGDVKAILRALFTSPAFYSPKAYRALVKSPTELLVGASRSLSVATDAFSFPAVSTRMGQALFNPPNVAGWPGGQQWINTSTWLERTNFANALLTARDDAHTMAPSFGAVIDRYNLTTYDTLVDYFAGVLLDGQLSPTTRRALVGYVSGASPLDSAATLGARALPAAALRPQFVDQKVRGLVYLMMASPEYQLA